MYQKLHAFKKMVAGPLIFKRAFEHYIIRIKIRHLKAENETGKLQSGLDRTAHEWKLGVKATKYFVDNRIRHFPHVRMLSAEKKNEAHTFRASDFLKTFSSLSWVKTRKQVTCVITNFLCYDRMIDRMNTKCG